MLTHLTLQIVSSLHLINVNHLLNYHYQYANISIQLRIFAE